MSSSLPTSQQQRGSNNGVTTTNASTAASTATETPPQSSNSAHHHHQRHHISSEATSSHSQQTAGGSSSVSTQMEAVSSSSSVPRRQQPQQRKDSNMMVVVGPQIHTMNKKINTKETSAAEIRASSHRLQKEEIQNHDEALGKKLGTEVKDTTPAREEVKREVFESNILQSHLEGNRERESPVAAKQPSLRLETATSPRDEMTSTSVTTNTVQNLSNQTKSATTSSSSSPPHHHKNRKPLHKRQNLIDENQISDIDTPHHDSPAALHESPQPVKRRILSPMTKSPRDRKRSPVASVSTSSSIAAGRQALFTSKSPKKSPHHHHHDSNSSSDVISPPHQYPHRTVYGASPKGKSPHNQMEIISREKFDELPESQKYAAYLGAMTTHKHEMLRNRKQMEQISTESHANCSHQSSQTHPPLIVETVEKSTSCTILSKPSPNSPSTTTSSPTSVDTRRNSSPSSNLSITSERRNVSPSRSRIPLSPQQMQKKQEYEKKMLQQDVELLKMRLVQREKELERVKTFLWRYVDDPFGNPFGGDEAVLGGGVSSKLLGTTTASGGNGSSIPRGV